MEYSASDFVLDFADSENLNQSLHSGYQGEGEE